MLLDKILFTLEDVREVRKVSVNIDDFDLYAREAQRNFLQKIIGAKLYTAILEDLDSGTGTPTSQRFDELLDGIIYEDGGTVRFSGLKIYLCYVWLHLYMADSAISITPTGAKVFKDDYAEHLESKKAYRNAEAHFIASADGMEEGILRYLDANRQQYPEFSESKRIEPAERSNMNFKVIGTSRTPPDEFYI